MANIKISVDYIVEDGSSFTFRAPCNSDEVDGLIVSHPGGDTLFVFKDAHGNVLTRQSDLFVVDALVKVVLDVTNGAVYTGNADTNEYLEKRIDAAGQIYVGSGDMPDEYRIQIDPDGAAIEPDSLQTRIKCGSDRPDDSEGADGDVYIQFIPEE